MQLKIFLRQTLLVVVFAGLAFFLALFFYFIQQSSNLFVGRQVQNTFLKSAADFPKKINFGLPVRLKIPEINIDSAVEYVGLTSDGAMDVPENQEDVAWFELGPRPGENGSAVIAGHYGWKYKTASVFDNLYKLRKGDKLTVEDGKGVVIPFVVREIRIYDAMAGATDVFSSNDGKAHLNLVACEGVWDKSSKSYSKRLVVFTDKE